MIDGPNSIPPSGIPDDMPKPGTPAYDKLYKYTKTQYDDGDVHAAGKHAHIWYDKDKNGQVTPYKAQYKLNHKTIHFFEKLLPALKNEPHDQEMEDIQKMFDLLVRNISQSIQHNHDWHEKQREERNEAEGNEGEI